MYRRKTEGGPFVVKHVTTEAYVCFFIGPSHHNSPIEIGACAPPRY